MQIEFEFNGVKWNTLDHGANTIHGTKVNDFYSWGSFSQPTRYVQCEFRDIALRKCVISGYQFIQCDFSKIDASDTFFIDCLFENCFFENANLSRTTFKGCAIIQLEKHIHVSSFEAAGLAQSRFISSSRQNSLLINLLFHGVGFRHSIFQDVTIRNIVIDYSSFENALLERVDVDRLKLDRSSCRGLVIKGCKISHYQSTLEKTIGTIGALEVLGSCEKITIDFAGMVYHSKEEIMKLFIGDRKVIKFADNGKLFEYINIMQYLYKELNKANRDRLLLSSQRPLPISRTEVIDGVPTSEFADFLYSTSINAYEKIYNSGESIDLENVLYILKLLYFLDINEYKFLQAISGIYFQLKGERKMDYPDFIGVSQIDFYLDRLSDRIVTNITVIRIHNESMIWKYKQDRIAFQGFVDQLFACSGIKEYRLISMHEGSGEAVIEFLTTPGIRNLLILIIILGCDIKMSTSKGFSFRFDLSRAVKSYAGFIKAIAKLAKAIMVESVSEKVFMSFVDKVSDELVEYTKKNMVSGEVKPKKISNEIGHGKPSKRYAPDAIDTKQTKNKKAKKGKKKKKLDKKAKK